MGKTLFAYSTTDGHTRRICERLCEALHAHGRATQLATIAEAERLDLAAYDSIVVAASIRYGKHKPEVVAFANRHRAVLEARPNAFFTVNVVARKAAKSRPETNPYMRQFLRQVRWRPKELEVFAGRIDYPRLGVLDRLVIRFIMWLTRGPTDPGAVVEFTDWQRVDAFGRRLAAM